MSEREMTESDWQDLKEDDILNDVRLDEEAERKMSKYSPEANGFSSIEDFNRWRG